MGGALLTNLADPVATSDAVNLQHLQASQASGTRGSWAGVVAAVEGTVTGIIWGAYDMCDAAFPSMALTRLCTGRDVIVSSFTIKPIS